MSEHKAREAREARLAKERVERAEGLAIAAAFLYGATDADRDIEYRAREAVLIAYAIRAAAIKAVEEES